MIEMTRRRDRELNARSCFSTFLRDYASETTVEQLKDLSLHILLREHLEPCKRCPCCCHSIRVSQPSLPVLQQSPELPATSGRSIFHPRHASYPTSASRLTTLSNPAQPFPSGLRRRNDIHPPAQQQHIPHRLRTLHPDIDQTLWAMVPTMRRQHHPAP